ncbi:MAG: hypothetical protein IKI29_07125 [Clostridia bacterium]|nr:hypothetical protein [Clostridia bacterium]
MIEVKPITEAVLLQSLFLENGLTVDSFSGGVAARCGEEMLGYCLYSLTEKGITVHCLEPQSDAFLADGVLRSALHVAAERSAMDARYSDSAPAQLLKHLGFIADEKEKKINIDLLFGGCHCHSE